jgi:hypothetical protein
MIRLFRTYAKRINRDELADFTRRYAKPFTALSQESFNGILSELGNAINETKGFDERLTVHKGHKFKTLIEVLDELLVKHGVSGPPSAADNLFGDQN